VSFLNEIRNFFHFFRRITFRRLLNVIKLRLSYFYSINTKTYSHKGFPESLTIEPTNTCNLKCIECPVGQNKLTRPKGNISVELLRKILDEIGPYIFHLNLYFQGEPFLHKNMFELIKLAHQKKIYITISTNGHFLTKNTIAQLLTEKPDRLIISIDGITQETYETYRKGGNLQKVLQGLELLSSIKKEGKHHLPFIEVQFIAFKHNEHEIPLLKSFFSKYHIQKLSIKKAFVENFKENEQLLPDNAKLTRYEKTEDGTYRLKRKTMNKCWRSWHSAVITWDGNIVPCCFDKDATYKFGNISTTSFKSIWKNQQISAFRAQILTDRNKIDICNNCVEGVKYKA